MIPRNVHRPDLVRVPASARPARLALVADEHDLVARIRGGDAAAFERLVRTYHRPLHAFVRGFVESPAVADDLLQDCFLTLWQRREAWQLHGALGAYLYAMARNAALRYLRHHRVVERWESKAVCNHDAPGMGTGAEPASRRAEAAETIQAVNRAIARLPPRCREAVILHLQNGLSFPETAEAMGVTVKAVERLYTKALRALRPQLTGHR